MPIVTGRHAILDQLVADGLEVMFGNPGTVEQGFLDALSDRPAIHYVLCLQESIAVLAGDAHARTTRRPTVVQIHSTPGLGNAIGALYQAWRGHAPLVVIGGDAGMRYRAMDAQMAGDLVGMAAPVTKWSTMVEHPTSLLRVLRRALKIAATPPEGPVYVCLPMDILDEPIAEIVRPTSLPSSRVAPDEGFLAEAAEVLLAAERPTIYMGDGIYRAEAHDELRAVAELLGAAVWGVDSGEVNLAYDHPLYQGQTGHMFGSHSLPILRSGDANLVCGTYIVPEVFAELGEVWDAEAKVVHIDLDSSAIARNHRVDLGVVADPKTSLGLLAEIIRRRQSATQRSAAAARAEASAAAKAAARDKELADDAAQRNAVPMHFGRFAEAMAARLPAEAVLFDEALTNSPALTRYCVPRTPGRFHQTRGGSLGVGLAGAVGLCAARPDAPVWVVCGDGGSGYTLQALWSLVRHGMKAKMVICNNGSYRLLQLNLQAYRSERGLPEAEYPTCFDLSSPPLRLDRIAEAMGVEAARVETPEQIEPALDRATACDGPFLIDVVLEGDVHPKLVGVRCGQ